MLIIWVLLVFLCFWSTLKRFAEVSVMIIPQNMNFFSEETKIPVRKSQSRITLSVPSSSPLIELVCLIT